MTASPPWDPWRRRSSPSGLLCHIGCDFREGGRLAAGVATLALGGRGRACIVSVDSPFLSSMTLRVEGFEQTLRRRYPEISVTGKLLFSPDRDPSGRGLFREECARFLEEQGPLDLIYYLYPGSDDFCRTMAELGEARGASAPPSSRTSGSRGSAASGSSSTSSPTASRRTLPSFPPGSASRSRRDSEYSRTSFSRALPHPQRARFFPPPSSPGAA